MWLNSTLDVLNLTLPKVPLSALKYISVDDHNEEILNSDISKVDQPFAESHVFEAKGTLIFKTIHKSGKSVYCVDLYSSDIQQLKYQPGDAIAILPENSDQCTEQFLSRTRKGIDIDDQIVCVTKSSKKSYLPHVTTLRLLYKQYVNFTCIPQKSVLKYLADCCSDDKEKRLLYVLASKEGSELYRKHFLESRITVNNIINALISCQPDALTLVDILPRLLPRPYSIASSCLHSKEYIRIVFSVLSKEHVGLCTGELKNQLENDGKIAVKIYLRKSNGFRLIDDPSVPLILVGPGTGIAPYMGFLQHRKYMDYRGKIYLFTGFKNKEDFLFKTEIQNYLNMGILTQLFVAYSRDEDENDKYVQDKIRKHWKEIGELIEEGAVIYECGDSKVMAQSISDAFTWVISQYSGIEPSEATLRIKAMKQSQKYLQDVWS